MRLKVQVYKIPDDFKSLVHVCGVYFLVRKGNIEYIGKSVNINNRLNGHRVFNRHYHDEVWVYPVDYKERWKLCDIEYDLIRKLNPPRNIHGK